MANCNPIIAKFHRETFRRINEEACEVSSDLKLVFSDGEYRYSKILFCLIYNDSCIKSVLLSHEFQCECLTTIIFPDLSVTDFEDRFQYRECKNGSETPIEGVEDGLDVGSFAQSFDDCGLHHHSDIIDCASFNRVDESKLVKIKETDNQLKLVCEECGLSFQRLPQLKKHRYQKHFHQNPIVCQICFELFDHQYELNKHSFKHLSDKLYICDICNVDFKRKGDLSRHKTSIHLSGPGIVSKYVCDICKVEFSRKDSLKRHNRRLHFTNSLS